ncbi:MAG TPA: hypothetical protein VJN18_18385 [Polyangiaceae bacterium]|nr:hypothetical protein [Polyangiaceae bacterium]
MNRTGCRLLSGFPEPVRPTGGDGLWLGEQPSTLSGTPSAGRQGNGASGHTQQEAAQAVGDRVRYWLNPSDPDFDAKAAKICKLYISPPAGTTVLCVDEKPGVQALRRTRAARPMRRGRPVRLEFEYERRGTRNIFAAFNVRDGRVLLWVTADRTTPMVLSFLDHIVRH